MGKCNDKCDEGCACEKEVSWEDNTIVEVNKLLKTFLPISNSGNLGLKYKPAVLEETEAGPIPDEHVASGVQIIIELDFMEPMTKP
jgi:hypothetical protein